ncbi:MAG: alpha/beta fold hydrolase [Alphaproteobacteria bacterium]|nr:alpha/beta fold hydrolase [Alphaproteobacteria bacterium]
MTFEANTRPAPFAPRLPWFGGDLQTMRNFLVRPRIDLEPWPGKQITFDAPDGSGDRLIGTGHLPSMDALQRPLVIIIHGLSGCEDGAHIRQSARTYLEAGYPVLRFNMRGAGPSRATCSGHYTAGASADLAAVLDQLDVAMPGVGDHGIVAVGFSLGANMLLKYLGESGQAARLAAAVAVSPPIDLSATSAHFRLRRNLVYHKWLLAQIKAQTVEPGARVTEDERQAVASARDIWQYDDRFLAPRFGYDGAEDYYASCSANRFLTGIARPTVVIHAADDPWIPPAMFRNFDWREAPNVTLELTAAGGHVGFHGRGSPIPWHDRYGLAFFARLDRISR